MGSLPAIPEDDTQLPDTGDDIAGLGGGAGGGAGGGTGGGAVEARATPAGRGSRSCEAAHSATNHRRGAVCVRASSDERNGWQQQQLGTSRKRAAPDSLQTVQAAAKRAALSPDNAVHTTLFPRGEVWALRLTPPSRCTYAHSEMTHRPAFHLRRTGGMKSRMAQAAR